MKLANEINFNLNLTLDKFAIIWFKLMEGKKRKQKKTKDMISNKKKSRCFEKSVSFSIRKHNLLDKFEI